MKRFSLVAVALLFVACAVPTARAQVLMRGDASYLVLRDRIRVNVEEITNYSDKTTGQLALMVWASKDPWEFSDRGRLIGWASLPRLLPLQSHSDVHRTIAYQKPHTGWYYITVTLEERVRTESGTLRWATRDRIEFNERQYFWRAGDHWPFPF